VSANKRRTRSTPNTAVVFGVLSMEIWLMNSLTRVLIVVTVLLSTNAFALDAPTPADNAQLKAMYEADQGERQAMFRAPPAERGALQQKIRDADAQRLRQTKHMLKNGEIRTAEDYWHAAFLLQHGESIDDTRLAFSLGMIATSLQPDNRKYRWITAASFDRILTRKKQPQWYGTQFDMDPATGKQVQLAVAEGAVTDAERTALGVPTLKESEDMLKQINGDKSP